MPTSPTHSTLLTFQVALTAPNSFFPLPLSYTVCSHSDATDVYEISMSTGTVLYRVHWTSQISKKHPVWNSGILSWDTGNSHASLLDEDQKKTLGETFINGGPKVGNEYRVGANMVEIIELESAPSSSSIQPAIISNSPKNASYIPLPAKRRALHPHLGARATQSDGESSPNSQPTTNTQSAPVRKKRPYQQLPYRPPSRVEPKPQIKAERKSVDSTGREAPLEEDNCYPIIPFDVPTPSLTHDENIKQSTANQALALSATTSSSSFVTVDWNAFINPSSLIRATAPQPMPNDSHQLPVSNTSIQNEHLESHTSIQPEDEALQVLNLPMADGSSRKRTFLSQARNIRDLTSIKPSSAPLQLPPRSSDFVLSSATSPSNRPPAFGSSLLTNHYATGTSNVTAITATINDMAVSVDPRTTIVRENFTPHIAAEIPHQQQQSPAFITHSSTNSTTNRSPTKATTQTPASISKYLTSSPKSATSPTKLTTPPSIGAFKSPASVNPHEAILGFGTKLLCFPSKATIARLPRIPRRTVSIPSTFTSLQDYKRHFSEAMYEDINHGLLPVASKFRDVLQKIARGPSGIHFNESIKNRITSSFKQVYFDCKLISYAFDHSRKKSKFGAGPDSASAPSAPNSPLYLRLPESVSNQEPSSNFIKDDLWIICTRPDFEPALPSEYLFFARSTMHGRSASVMEIKLMGDGSFGSDAKTKSLKLDGELTVHAIHALAIASETSMLDTLNDLSVEYMPLLPQILNSNHTPPPPNLVSEVFRYSLPSATINRYLNEYLSSYHMNEDQAEVFKRAAVWFDNSIKTPASKKYPLTLVHGVFGSGKSHMLVVLIMFICELMEQISLSDPRTQGAEETTAGMRILVSASTNTAVDRILVGLLDEGFTDFVRVGSLKRINSRIIPYSIHREKRVQKGGGSIEFESTSAHGTGGWGKSNEYLDRSALRDLEELLHSRSLSSVDRALIEQRKMEIESGQFERKLSLVDQARVVGATCIASAFPILSSSRFDIVILDECSQMPEPLSLLPAARFKSNAYILVGDPLQLPPQLKSKPKSDDIEQDGLGCALFSRLSHLGNTPILLRTQYRLHPTLSAIPNELFYAKRLINGVTPQARAPLHSKLPTLLFIDSESGSERTSFGGSIENVLEANVVCLILQQLVSTLGIEGDKIGVICLYKAQVSLLEGLLTRSFAHAHVEPFKDDLSLIQISTVDAFQGAEKDIIILSCCRSESLGFIDSSHRLNVSLTRARRHLIIVGSSPILISSPSWKTVLHAAKACGPRSFISSDSILAGDYFSSS